MNKQEKLDKIYEVIARKDLSFGCIVSNGDKDFGVRIKQRRDMDDVILHKGKLIRFDSDIVIIGHPVMIGDVLDWYDNNKKDGFSAFENRGILALQYNKPREPIENQSNECIDYIYSLITK